MSSVDSTQPQQKSWLSWRRNARDAREFLPAALEILETPASPAGRALAGTIILLIVVALAWAVLGRVDIIASATGKVVASGRTKTIQPLETGIVTAINVQDGHHVTLGQVLVELDHTVTRAERERVERDLVSNRLDVARLSALARSFKNLSTPQDLEVPAAASSADIDRTRAAMLAQAAEQSAKRAAIEQQIGQKTAEAQSIKATITKIDAILPYLEETLTVRKRAMDIQFGNRIAWLEAISRLTDQKQERIVQERRLVEIEAARRALEKQDAQTVSGFERQVLIDLSDAKKKVETLTQDLIKAQQKTDEQVLRAPIEGTVQQLALHTVGGVVTPAQQLMAIVPVDSELEVEAMISNRDIGFVEPGQDVEIKIDTFNFTRYGLVHGKVVSVSQDAIMRDKPVDRNNAQKMGTLSETSEPSGQELLYSARVSLDSTKMQIDDKLVSFAPGMAVTVEIKTSSRRLIEYVLSPLLRYKHESLRER